MTAAKPDAPAIYAALSAVMVDVQAVAKSDRNDHQKFMFRGIDSVVNAVGPALRKHSVVVAPSVVSVDYETVLTTTGKPTLACRVVVDYTFYAVDGSSMTTRVAAEAADSGDKATPKAMSVAFRIALLQALTLPTDEPDPDHDVYERTAERRPTEAQIASAREWIGSLDAYDQEGLRALWREHGDLLDIDVDGVMLRTAIMDRVALLDAADKASAEAEAGS